MKTTIRFLAVFALALTTVMHDSTASAATDGFKFRGDSVTAFFSSTDGCIVTDVAISATEGSIRSDPGAPNPLADTFLFIRKYDFCAGDLLLSLSGFHLLSDGNFEVSNQLEYASLNTTISAFDFVSETWIDIDVDLNWTAVGPLTRQRYNDRLNTPGCIIHTRFNDKSRVAEASGSISDGMMDFTPEVSFQAYIVSSKSGFMTVGCT